MIPSKKSSTTRFNFETNSQQGGYGHTTDVAESLRRLRIKFALHDNHLAQSPMILETVV